MSQVQESVALSIVSSSSVHRGVKWLSDMFDKRRFYWGFARSLMILRLAVLLSYLAANGQMQGADSLVKRLKKLDRNKDGKLARDEAPKSFRRFKFDIADRNRDGLLDAQELNRVSEKLAAKKKAAPVKTAKQIVPVNGKMRMARNIVFQKDNGASNGRNRLDLYLPRDKKEFPVIFWIHGGGLHSGDKSKIADVAARFVAEGIGVASTNYRLYPEVQHPMHIEDVATAFAWVHKNIAAHDGDPQKIFVVGGSAGGYLAALLSLDETYLKNKGLTRRDICGSIPISGLMNVSRVGAARRKGVWGNISATHRSASPLYHATKNAPPILILYAEHDTTDRQHQNEAMFAALKKSGHQDVAIHELKNRTHNNIRSNLVNQKDPGAGHILKFISRLSKRD